MAINLKQRIVGAIVLVALAVIFIPIILQRTPQDNLTMLELTERPTVAKIEFTSPEKLQTEVSAKVAVPKKVLETQQPIIKTKKTNRETNKEKAKPASSLKHPTTPALQQAWSVQVASFSQMDNAKNLVKKLQNMGYPAYWRQIKQDSKLIVRVYVGPQTNRQEAETILKALAEKVKLKGYLVVYDPFST